MWIKMEKGGGGYKWSWRWRCETADRKPRMPRTVNVRVHARQHVSYECVAWVPCVPALRSARISGVVRGGMTADENAENTNTHTHSPSFAPFPNSWEYTRGPQQRPLDLAFQIRRRVARAYASLLSHVPQLANSPHMHNWTHKYRHACSKVVSSMSRTAVVQL